MHICDNELVTKAQAGSTEAFDVLVSRHQERVYTLACRVLGNAEDAADVQQETFVRAWLNLRKFKGHSAFSTWLHRITVNLCLSRRRRKSYYDCSLEPCVDLQSSGDMSIAAAVESTTIVREVLAEIPAHYRVLLVLREIEGRSIEEIAAVVGGSTTGTRTRLHRARKVFRERMRPYLAEEEG